MGKANLVNRQCEQLSQAIQPLLKNLRAGAKIGLYCVVSSAGAAPPHLDDFEKYEQENEPTVWLRDLPVTVAHWCAVLTGARGPVKIFNHPQLGYAQALDQARLDLEFGAIEQAVICGHELESAKAELLP